MRTDFNKRISKCCITCGVDPSPTPSCGGTQGCDHVGGHTIQGRTRFIRKRISKCCITCGVGTSNASEGPPIPIWTVFVAEELSTHLIGQQAMTISNSI